jgi:hypothetical protein
MTLQERLNEFRFNLETMELLQSLGRTRSQVVNEMSQLNFSETLVNFYNDSRTLFNSVMLRLNLYSEQNQTEQRIRTSLSVLNNSMVNSLVDYLYNVTSLQIETPPQVNSSHETITSQPVNSTSAQSQLVEQQLEVASEDSAGEESAGEKSGDEESDPFESFFTSCVKQTDEPTDIVKSSDFYQAFSEWFESNYDEEVPDKKELKGFLNDRLGKSKKNTWTNVVLTC